MTNQEIEDFISNQNQIEFTEINKKNSIKSNIYIFFNNFNGLAIYLNNIREAIKYIRDLLNINNLLVEILNKIQTNKLVLDINYEQEIDTNVVQTLNNIEYNLYRESDTTIVITNLTNNDWNVNNLIIQVKDNSNIIVNDIQIITENKTITLNFASIIDLNYKIIIL